MLSHSKELEAYKAAMRELRSIVGHDVVEPVERFTGHLRQERTQLLNQVQELAELRLLAALPAQVRMLEQEVERLNGYEKKVKELRSANKSLDSEVANLRSQVERLTPPAINLARLDPDRLNTIKAADPGPLLAQLNQHLRQWLASVPKVQAWARDLTDEQLQVLLHCGFSERALLDYLTASDTLSVVKFVNSAREGQLEQH